MIGKSFMGNAMTAAPMQPYSATAPLLERGMPIGIDAYGRPVLFDPWKMKQSRMISSMIFLVIGNKDTGKSALLKSIVALLMCLQAQAGQEIRFRGDERKREEGEPEMAKLAHQLGCQTVPLDQVRINIFDPKMVRDKLSLLGIAKKVLELILLRELTEYENLALQISVHTLWSGRSRKIISPEVLAEMLRKMNSDDYDSYFEVTEAKIMQNHQVELDDDPELKYELSLIMKRPNVTTNMQELTDAAGRLNAALMQVIDGVYGEMFSGKQSLYSYLTQPALILDWSSVEEFQQIMLQTILYSFETAAMRANMTDVIPHLRVAEEEHEGMTMLPWLQAKATRNAKARSLPTADFSTTQFINGLKIGDEGSHIREVADRINRGTDAIFVGGQPFDEKTVEGLMEWGFSRSAAIRAINNSVGEFSLKLRKQSIPPVRFQHVLTSPLREVVMTNAAVEKMLKGRIHVWDDPEVVARLKQAGHNVDRASTAAAL